MMNQTASLLKRYPIAIFVERDDEGLFTLMCLRSQSTISIRDCNRKACANHVEKYKTRDKCRWVTVCNFFNKTIY